MSIRNLDEKRRHQNLDQLEGIGWGPPTFESYLVTTCHRLRTKPIREFTVEDLRIMIGQNIGLMFLVPLALEKLAADPLAEGDYYPGDLLCSLLNADQKFWQRHTDLKSRLEVIITQLSEMSESVDEWIADKVREFQKRMT